MSAHEAPKSFIRKYIFSMDHKVIGIQYFITAMVMGVIAGLLAMLIRMQLGWPGAEHSLLAKILPAGFSPQVATMRPEFYAMLFTMHGTLMVFFVLSTAPVSGFGNFLIPLQIGARDMAFPFLNMLSYWTFLTGCIIILSSFFVTGGAAAAGWTAYPPLSALREAIPGSMLGQTLWIIGMVFFIASFTMGGLNFVTTILNLRTRGLKFSRLPMMMWVMFCVGIVGLLSFPALTAAAIMLLFDRHFGTSFFLPSGIVLSNHHMPNQGGSPLLWQHLFWFLGHPEVYILMLPAMGITSDVITVFARKPLFGYKAMVGATIAISTLSFLVWGHHMFVSGMNPYLGMAFAVFTLLIAVPSAVKVFNWLATLWRANIHFTTPMLFALGVVSLFISGGLSGIWLGQQPIDIQVHDTYFVVGHFHLIMAGAALFGVFAGTYFWFPKMFGRMMNETLGKIHFWLTIVTYYLTFFPMYYLGLHGHMRRIYDPTQYSFLKPLQGWNHLISLSAFVLGAAQFIFFFNFFWSLFKGKKAGPNPWKANTLEWTTTSPAPHGNWEGDLPVVYRWPYDYSVPDAENDYLPQNVSPQSERPVPSTPVTG